VSMELLHSKLNNRFMLVCPAHFCRFLLLSFGFWSCWHAILKPRFSVVLEKSGCW